jgi:hypothetical protein
VPLAVVIKEPNLLGDLKSRAILGGKEDVIKPKVVDFATEVTLDRICDLVAIRHVNRHVVDPPQGVFFEVASTPMAGFRVTSPLPSVP